MSEQIIKTIRKIERARTTLRQAMADNELVASPMLKDLSLIPKIYGIFQDIKNDEITANERKEFIFVIIYLYAPCRFFGGKMPKGLRRAIGKATGVSAMTAISNNCTELMVLYTTYQDFRQGVDQLLKAVYNDIIDVRTTL